MLTFGLVCMQLLRSWWQADAVSRPESAWSPGRCDWRLGTSSLMHPVRVLDISQDAAGQQQAARPRWWGCPGPVAWYRPGPALMWQVYNVLCGGQGDVFRADGEVTGHRDVPLHDQPYLLKCHAGAGPAPALLRIFIISYHTCHPATDCLEASRFPESLLLHVAPFAGINQDVCACEVAEAFMHNLFCSGNLGGAAAAVSLGIAPQVRSASTADFKEQLASASARLDAAKEQV